MIKVDVRKVNGNITTIVLTGHALYAPHGKDIVCAAVSSTLITTVNGILLINDSIDYKEKKDTVSIKIKYIDDITNKLLTNMVNNLSELEKDYKDNIKIMIKEE